MNILESRKSVYLCVFILAIVTSCVPIISPYSATAYELTTSLKAESLALIGEATNPYGEHEDAVDELVLEISKATEFALGRPQNEVAVKQWRLIMNPEGNLLGGFLRRWQSEEVLNANFVDQAGGNIAEAFDLVIRLEVAKLPEGAQY